MATTSLQFLTAVDVKGYMGHFNSTVRPVFSAPVTQPEADELEHCDRTMRNSKALLMQKMPHSIAVVINSIASISVMWKHVSNSFTTKGMYAQTNLCAEFLQPKCSAGGNVWESRLCTQNPSANTLGRFGRGSGLRSMETRSVRTCGDLCRTYLEVEVVITLVLPMIKLDSLHRVGWHR
jgi:hypothetical protein